MTAEGGKCVSNQSKEVRQHWVRIVLYYWMQLGEVWATTGQYVSVADLTPKLEKGSRYRNDIVQYDFTFFLLTVSLCYFSDIGTN